MAEHKTYVDENQRNLRWVPERVESSKPRRPSIRNNIKSATASDNSFQIACGLIGKHTEPQSSTLISKFLCFYKVKKTQLHKRHLWFLLLSVQLRNYLDKSLSYDFFQEDIVGE